MYKTLFFISIIATACGYAHPQTEYASLPDRLRSDPDNRWIIRILNYEATRGSAFGTGLAYWGFRHEKPKNIEEAIRFFHRDFLPRVKAYPPGVRERLGDYYFNTGRSPEDLLLYVNGTISLERLNKEKTHRELWKKHKEGIFRSFSQPDYLHRLDTAKDKVYRTTRMENGKTNPAYEKTWKARVWMWSEPQ